MQLEHAFTVPVGVEEAWEVLRNVERIGPCMPGATIESVDGEDFTGRVKVKVGPMQITYRGRASFTEVDDVAHRGTIEAHGRETRGSGTADATISAELVEEEGGASTRVQITTDLAVTGKPAQFGRGVMADVGQKLIDQFAECLADELSGPQAADEEAAAAEPSVEGAPHAGAATTDEEGGATVAGGVVTTDPNEPALAPVPSTATPGTTAGGSTPTDADIAGAGVPVEGAPGSARDRERGSDEAIDLLGVAGGPIVKRAAAPAAIVLLVLVLVWWWRRRR